MRIQPARSTRQHPRSAFTLMEIMLVLAVMVAIAMIVFPQLDGALEQQRLRSAGEHIRAAWINARSDAMMTGEIHLFRYEPGTGDYSVQRWINADTSSSTGLGAGASTASDDTLALPDEVTFAGASQVDDARAEYESAQMSGADTGSAPSVMFYPDGRTSTVDLELVNKAGTRVMISMRGVTGVVSMSDTYAEGEAP